MEGPSVDDREGLLERRVISVDLARYSGFDVSAPGTVWLRRPTKGPATIVPALYAPALRIFHTSAGSGAYMIARHGRSRNGPSR
jgi:hypothetical protein